MAPVSPDIVVFLVSAFAAAFVTGLAGFAFGMIAAAIWLHALTPAETTTLIVAYALLVQGYAVWKLRRAIDVSRLAPFIAGSAVGVPAGLLLLQGVSQSGLRKSVGIILIAFSVYNLMRPRLPTITSAGRSSDAVVGALNGILGGATGLGGVLPAIWAGMRGWSRDEQRAVFQPTAVATFLLTMLLLGGFGIVTERSVRLFVIGLPALGIGTWLGWTLYGRLDEAAFRKVVLGLLALSGTLLVLASR